MTSHEDLVQLMCLERLEVNLFRGGTRNYGGRSVFGGLVIGQAVSAANQTVEDRPIHSLHAYFLLPGDMTAPIVYEVDRIRDGGSFTSRRVQAIQNGRPILSLIASFHKEEEGFDHQLPMPGVPKPEDLKLASELVPVWLAEAGPVDDHIRAALEGHVFIETKPINPRNPFRPAVGEPVNQHWFRVPAKLPDDPQMHRALLAYASDWGLLGTAMRPHAATWLSSDMMVASIDHAVWFHRELRVDDWLLYTMDSPSASNARGLTRGLIYDRNGHLVASTAQEGLIRPIKGRKTWERSLVAEHPAPPATP
jgi:acyl-CoA thioesterase-2